MEMSKLPRAVCVISICIVQICFLLLTVVGVYVFLFNVESNQCEMTYMFEMPQYIKIKLKRDTKAAYPRYNLYYYAEGNRAQKFSGIPALFIPGNAGSYKQVRSVGSVALRMAEEMRVKKYDFFALDFNEEFSAFSGSLLKRQTEFTRLCVEQIMTMFGGNGTLVLIGHSMGGVIARALFLSPGFDRLSVSVVMTQATPHEMPVLMVDATMKKFYDDINDAWKRMSDEIYWDQKEGREPRRVTIVSTGGGERDLMVRTDLTGLSWIGSHHDAIWTSTHSMPKAWTSTDHLCHVWCKQVVLATVRALYDIIDSSTNQISTNDALRYDVMKYHFSTNHGRRFYSLTPPLKTINKQRHFKLEAASAPWRYFGKIHQPRYIMFNVADMAEAGTEFLALSDVETPDWIGACTTDLPTNSCVRFESLATSGFLLPSSSGGHFKAVHLRMEELESYSVIILVLPHSTRSVQAAVDVFSGEQRSYKVVHKEEEPLTTYLSPSHRHHHHHHHHHHQHQQEHYMEMNFDSKESLYHSISFDSFSDLLTTYDAHVESTNCSDVEAVSVMKFEDARGEYPSFAVIKNERRTRMTLRLMSEGVEIPANMKARPGIPMPTLRLYLASNCSFRVKISLSLFGTAGQVVRFLLPHIGSFVLVWIVPHLRRVVSGKEVAPSVAWISLCDYFTITSTVSIFKFAMSYVGLEQILKVKDDFLLIKATGALPLLLLSSLNLSLLLVAAINLSCAIVSHSLFFLVRCLGLDRPISVPPLRAWMALLLIGCLLLISFISCGAVVLFVVHIVYFGKVILQRLNRKLGGQQKRPRVADPLTSTFFISLIHFLFNFPTLIIWFKDPKHFHLLEDSSFIHSAVSSIALCCLQWTGYFNGTSRAFSSVWWSRLVSLCLLLLVPPVILFSSVSLYRASFFIDIIFLLISLHSIIPTLLNHFYIKVFVKKHE